MPSCIDNIRYHSILKCTFLLCTLFYLFSGCVKSTSELTSQPPEHVTNDFITYTIKKGEHYSDAGYQSFIGKELRFEVIFDSSCIYNTNLAENSADINKVYGVSDCGTRHQENSARVGWLWKGSAVELYSYCYFRGERSSKLIGTTSIGKTNTLSISASGDQYIFEYEGETTKMKRYCNDALIKGYRLYPYFGGDETPPHDIRIRIRELKSN